MSPEFRDHVLDLLSPLGPVTARRMFGGDGLFLDDTMFCLISDDVLYMKADEVNRGDFEAAGMAPFRYARGGATVALSYFEVPPDVMEDSGQMVAWARLAWEAARRAGLGKRRK